MDNLQSKDLSNEIVEISKETSLEEVAIEPKIIDEPKALVEQVDVKPTIIEEEKKQTELPNDKVSVCRIYLHLDKILLITIISCAVLMKLIMDFPEFLILILITIIFTSAIAYGYLYPEKSMKVLERFMIMNMLVNPMAIGF